MSLRIVNWNVQWAQPGSWRGAAVVERIFSEAPDVVCLTETNDCLLPSGYSRHRNRTTATLFRKVVEKYCCGAAIRGPM